jgi:phosphoribosylformylglycinamidine synthase II/phosphoribosylformylglycinamidine synthase I
LEETQALTQHSSFAQPSFFRVEVRPKQLTELPYHIVHLYFLDGALSVEALCKISEMLLTDPVTEQFALFAIDPTGQITETFQDSPIPTCHKIEVMLLPGVTDPVAENLVKAAHLIGIPELTRASTGRQYVFSNTTPTAELERLAHEQFSNPVIQRVAIDKPIAPAFVSTHETATIIEIIPIQAVDDNGLLKISAERRLALNLEEMQAIRTYYQQEKRDPTDAELEMLAQTWSEHCVHKTFKAIIDYTGPAHGAAPDSPPVTQTVNGLLKTYIRAATEQVNKEWVRSAFVDNAGIIAFDNHWDLAFKVETHNHPSAIEPFGGANTGVGGVVRDILGVSARPIANTDVLCFGYPDTPPTDLPEGVFHPRRVADGVVHGVEDYGNKMGIPTVNGAILYHAGYTANPLVYCGCLGILPHGSHPNGVQAGDLIVVIGGRTGRDGLRGATFSSMEMDTTTGEIAGSSVQIGHPINEKQVQEVVLRLRDERLYHAITDCGAGGLSSAVGEMATGLGADVQLETVPLKYPGLQPWEIWLSEAQERMVLAIPAEHWAQTQAICAGQNVEATCIGTFEASGRVKLTYHAQFVGDLSVEFLHEGIPQRHLKAVWTPPSVRSDAKSVPDHKTSLLKLLAHPNIRSKEDVIRRYDHEVQGATMVKPLVGVENHGPSDAAVLVPLDSQREAAGQERVKGVALSVGVCPTYGELDPYAMAWAAIDEAMRNLVAVGADPSQVAILDNFCWGNPNLPDRLGALVRCAQGCYDAAFAYDVPFISGKDSLNNEYADATGQKHAIPGTLLISAVGIVPDVHNTVTMDLKQTGNLLYLVGETRNEMGGSHFNLVHEIEGGVAPQPISAGLVTMQILHDLIANGAVQACHDCSEGGLAVALAEMCLAGRLGANVQLNVDDPDAIWPLFAESLCRFVVEVKPEDAEAFELEFRSLPSLVTRIGVVSDEPSLTIESQDGTPLLTATVAELEQAWRGKSAEISTSGVSQNAAAKPMPTLVRSDKFPRILILHANGSNRDREAALACELAGGQPEIVHVNQLLSGERHLLDYHMLILPGGFSYGDDLGAGSLWALNLRQQLGQDVARFVEEGRPVLGICNGFQALVKAGLLPGFEWVQADKRGATLTFNESAHFECRWVYLQPNSNSPSIFTKGLDEPIYCPVAHGEGQLAASPEILENILAENLAGLVYTNGDGSTAGYPANPNGSAFAIAGLSNRQGNVFGLMPHPEDHIFAWQHPRWRRGERGMDGLRLFQNGVNYARS